MMYNLAWKLDITFTTDWIRSQEKSKMGLILAQKMYFIKSV